MHQKYPELKQPLTYNEFRAIQILDEEIYDLVYPGYPDEGNDWSLYYKRMEELGLPDDVMLSAKYNYKYGMYRNTEMIEGIQMCRYFGSYEQYIRYWTNYDMCHD